MLFTLTVASFVIPLLFLPAYCITTSKCFATTSESVFISLSFLMLVFIPKCLYTCIVRRHKAPSYDKISLFLNIQPIKSIYLISDNKYQHHRMMIVSTGYPYIIT